MITIYFPDRELKLLTRDEAKDFGSSPVLHYPEQKEELKDFIVNFMRSDEPSGFVLTSDPEETLSEAGKEIRIIDAAGGIVRNSKDELLCIFRLGKWDLPKGKCEKGEKTHETAQREVMEECGITNIRIMEEEAQLTYHAYQIKGKTVIKRTFWYAMLFEGNESLTPQIEEDITEVRWISPDHIHEILQNTYPSIKHLFVNK